MEHYRFVFHALPDMVLLLVIVFSAAAPHW